MALNQHTCSFSSLCLQKLSKLHGPYHERALVLMQANSQTEFYKFSIKRKGPKNVNLATDLTSDNYHEMETNTGLRFFL